MNLMLQVEPCFHCVSFGKIETYRRHKRGTANKNRKLHGKVNYDKTFTPIPDDLILPRSADFFTGAQNHTFEILK